MKKFLLICVALIAFIATNASGGNQFQTEFRTCMVQPPPLFMPVYNFVANQMITPVTFIAQLERTTATQTEIAVQTFKSDGWRAPKWIPSLAINCTAIPIAIGTIIFKDNPINLKHPTFAYIDECSNRITTNYNINQSYGLRY